ncbi:oxidoreductase nitrogenase component 1 [Planctomycetales bacterium]|nr:oxidoreductase nitrogenase component 1 [Planctomycetales bacterium]GHT04767.1 oxidoreductase nitrogenase component 1 [Planctomycetales bacterium]
MTSILDEPLPPLVAALERPRWSCALGGALAAVGALPRTIPVMHAGPGCASNFTWMQNGSGGLATGGYCSGLAMPGSNLQDSEVVFGGHERLSEELANTVKIMDGDLYFVLTGCVPEVIGDDVDAVVTEYVNAGKPVVFASTAGFKGNSYFGYEQVLKTLFKSVVEKGAPKQNDLVNVWGVPPTQDVFWRGNLQGVARLLQLLGFRANYFFGSGADLDLIKKSAGARLNIVLSDLYGIEAAELFKELHGVDFISTPLPFGAAATERFLRTVGAALKVSDEAVEKIIDAEGRRHYEYLEGLLEVFNDMEAQRYAIVIGDANYAFATADFLAEDLGFLPDLIAVTDDLTAEKREILLTKRSARVAGRYGEKSPVVFIADGAHLTEAVDDTWRAESWKKYHPAKRPAIVVGSSLDRGLAAALGAAHLTVAFPVSNRAVLNRGYTGYDGGLTLAEDVISSFIAAR